MIDIFLILLYLLSPHGVLHCFTIHVIFCRIQGARRRTIQSPAIRPIADIDEITDEALPSVSSRTPASQFKLPERIMGLASKVFKKSKRKQEYQTVPSTESLDDINETTQL